MKVIWRLIDGEKEDRLGRQMIDTQLQGKEGRRNASVRLYFCLCCICNVLFYNDFSSTGCFVVLCLAKHNWGSQGQPCKGCDLSGPQRWWRAGVMSQTPQHHPWLPSFFSQPYPIASESSVGSTCEICVCACVYIYISTYMFYIFIYIIYIHICNPTTCYQRPYH